MIERYSRKEIKKVWDEKNKYRIWLEIEILATSQCNPTMRLYVIFLEIYQMS